MKDNRLALRVKEIQGVLHEIPEVGFAEYKTAAFLAQQLGAAGYQIQTGVGGTGIIGLLTSDKPGPVLALRADMDALGHLVDGKECAIHSCGHDSHSAMVLTVAEELARKGIECGTVKILFQPAEECLFGAVRVIADGAIDDVDVLIGIHLRPMQEAKTGQATPALYHGSSYIVEAVISGLAAHAARPHLGVNAIDAAAAAIQAVNAIHIDPTIPATAKVTKIQAGGPALNAIPDKAYIALDLRTQKNDTMEELISKVTRAIKGGAATVGAEAKVEVIGGVPAAEYNSEITALAAEAITAVLGEEGLLDPLTTPGGEDFHFYVQHKPSLKVGYIGLGANAAPGLHHPEMKFDRDAMINGVNIILYMVNKLVGIKA